MFNPTFTDDVKKAFMKLKAKLCTTEYRSYMYMYDDNNTHAFKHKITRKYVFVDVKTIPFDELPPAIPTI